MNITELNNCYKLHRTLERSGTNIAIYNAKNSTVQGLTIYGRSKKSKNLLEITAESQTINGVKFTVVKDSGSVSYNGVPESGLARLILNQIIIPAGTYYFNGFFSTSIEPTESRAQIYKQGHTGEMSTQNWVQYISDGVTPTVIDIIVTFSTPINTATFRPMLCTATDYEADPTFEPYFEGIKSVGDNGLTVTTCRKNFFNINGEVNYKWTGTAFVVDTDPATMSTVNDGVLTTKNNLSIGHARGQIINVEKNRRYTLSVICDYLPQDGIIGVAVYGINDDGSMGTYKTDIDSTVVGEVQSAKFTPSTNRIYVEFGTLRASGASTYPTGSTYSRIQLEKGNSVTEYEQYRGSTAEITTALPLRGISDTVRDKLTCTADAKQVETVCGEVDLGTLNWRYDAIRQWFISIELNKLIKPTPTIEDKGNLLCSIYTTYSINDMWATSTDNAIGVNENATLYVRNNNYTDPTDFKSAMAGVMLVYEFATPVTTPLTTAEILQAENLQTFNPETNVQNSSNAEMTIKYNRRIPN